jgi:hypothetical protein
MSKHDGDEVISQGFFREYLRWMEQYYAYHLEQDAGIIRQSVTISDIISGIYSAPDETQYTGLPSVLTGLFNKFGSVISYIDEQYLLAHQYTVAVDGSVSSLHGDVDILTAYAEFIRSDVDQHIQHQEYHLIPDELSIITDVTKLKIKDSYVRGLFSASDPITLSGAGVLTLKIDSNTLEIVGGVLKAKTAGSTTYSLSFNALTSILTFTPSVGNAVEINLESLKTGGSINLDDYVKKTGQTLQTIQGNIAIGGNATAGGTIAASSEITAFAQ